jgi:hypothetical protein
VKLPEPPLFTGDDRADLQLLKQYVYDMYRISLNTPIHGGYTAVGLNTDRTITSTDALPAVRDVVATIINDLIDSGVINR